MPSGNTAPPLNPSTAFPAAEMQGETIWINGAAQQVQFAPISAAAAATTTVVAAVASRRIRVIDFFLTFSGAAGTALFQTSTGAVALTGPMAAAQNGQINPQQNSVYGYCETAVGDALQLTMAGAGCIGAGLLVYVTY